MKKLVATAPRVAALVEYEDRAISANEVKIRVRFGAPKHGTEVVDFRAASPFINDDFNGEWQMFTPRPANAPRGVEFGALPAVPQPVQGDAFSFERGCCQLFRYDGISATHSCEACCF